MVDLRLDDDFSLLHYFMIEEAHYIDHFYSDFLIMLVLNLEKAFKRLILTEI